MSRTYSFRVVNVFAESRLSGNPLAVIEDASGLSDEEMQQLALQFNLSETTFVLPSKEATARVRIFTPEFEMPFAGHPTLGTAHVLRALGRGGDAQRLHLNAGIIPVAAGDDETCRDVWTLTANAPTHRPYEFAPAQIASALGLAESDIAAAPLWMNAGVEQLVVPLVSVEAVSRANPRQSEFNAVCRNAREAHAYVFARDNEARVVARYFWQQHGAVLEDPGTGSACANLGAYLLTTKPVLPFRQDVHQGAATGRPCLLHLHVDAAGRIHVGGRVVELMRGALTLD